MLPLTAIVPVLGYWSSLQGLGNWVDILLLAGLGASAHIFGFGLNDIVDLSIDKNADYRKDSPLVSGKMSIGVAWIIVLFQLPLMFILYHVNGNHEMKITGDIILLVSILLSSVYNFFSKKGLVKRWMAELSLAASIGFLCLAGSYLYDFKISTASILFSSAFALVLLSINSLGSGLKDLKTDLQAGGKSFVIENGARMIGADQIFISSKLKVYGVMVQLLILINIFFYHFTLHLLNLYSLIPFLFWLLGLLYLQHLLSQKTFTMLNKKGPLLYGYFNLLALMLLQWRVMPVWLIIILLIIGAQLIFTYFSYKYFTKP